MNNKLLLPRLAWNGILKNKSSYFPYMLTYIFSAAVFFIMLSIAKNPLLATAPHAEYLQALMMIGYILLGLILAPFLIATNGFLIKRRKKELGLYSILGMEKKHIGVILLIEAALIYVVSVGFGILIAVVFSKLIFLLLTKVSRLSVEAVFMLDGFSVKATLLYFGALSFVNLIVSLFRVSLSNPAELFKESRKGEKEMKHIFIFSAAGLILLGSGYSIALKSKLNMLIFSDFFLSVALVAAGTYFVFVAGSVAFLKLMKRNRRFYYRAENFVTVSGMLYRMKKSASDLSNICIFSTMVMITLLCTVTLFCGEEDSVRYLYHYDNSIRFYSELFPEEKRKELISVAEQAARETGIELRDMTGMDLQILAAELKGSRFVKTSEGTSFSPQKLTVGLLTLEEFNRIEGTREVLADGEVLVYSCAKDFGCPELELASDVYQVKKELKKVSFKPKEEKAINNNTIYIIFKDPAMIAKYALAYAPEQEAGDPDFDTNRRYFLNYNMEGEREAQEALTAAMNSWCAAQQGFLSLEDINEGRKVTYSMDGGLLFIGVFFGITFSVCLVLIIYYKQITEGYEDQDAFSIMKKVGMDSHEIQATIRRQIRMVFFLPFFASVAHTFVSLNIVSNLMGSLNVYDESIILTSAIGVMAAFVAFYGISYLMTAKSYYKIVR